jgi:tetratricopeptide (TPR) repeat protein
MHIPARLRGALGLLGAALLVSCSTAPKKPAEIRQQRDGAEKQLEQANRQAERGDFEGALSLVELARQLAVTADDPGLRVRAALSRGNILWYQGKADEAAREWEDALAEAEASGDAELASAARIYHARGRLLRAAPEEREALAATVKRDLRSEIPRMKRDKRSAALGWTVIALADKEGRRFGDAEAAARQALDIHLKGNYLEQAAYDWYLIASIRSVAGDYPGARAALEEAIVLDRRAENSWGLAMDWRALAEVYRKAGNAGQAEAAAARSKEILRALGQDPGPL